MKTGDLKVYDLENVISIICGLPIEGGYGEGDVIKIDPSEATFTVKKGADGSITRSKTYNGHVKITLTLMQSSEANALLSALHETDRLGKNGAGVGPTLIKDLGGASLHSATKSWIAGPPTATYGREATHRDWPIETANMVSFIGGN